MHEQDFEPEWSTITSKELEITQENRGRGIENYKTKGTPLQELKLKPWKHSQSNNFQHQAVTKKEKKKEKRPRMNQ